MLRLWLMTLTCVLVHCYVTADTSTGSTGDRKLFCYYSSFAQKRSGRGRFLPENINPHLCTHVIFAFVNLVKGRDLEPANVNDITRKDTGLYDRTLALKRKNPNLKVLLAVGGWYIGSAPFIPMIGKSQNRKKFIRNVVIYLRQNGFDGLDMDWEFPATRGSPPDDKYRFTQLLQELQAAFREEADAYGGQKLLLTVAAAGGLYFIKQAYEPEKIIQHVDYLLLMAYNYHGSWNKETGHHSGLYPGAHETGPNRQLNQKWTTDFWLGKGAPPSKLVVGIATYGMSFHLLDPKKNGVGAPSAGGGAAGPYTRESGILAYYEICQFLKQGWRRVWLDDQKAPYAYNNHEWVGYDDVISVTLKANYIRDHGFAGAFIWSLEMDDFSGSCGEGKYPLLRTIANILRPSEYKADMGGTFGDEQSLEVTQKPARRINRPPSRKQYSLGQKNVPRNNTSRRGRDEDRRYQQDNGGAGRSAFSEKPKSKTPLENQRQNQEFKFHGKKIRRVSANYDNGTKTREENADGVPMLIMFWGPERENEKERIPQTNEVQRTPISAIKGREPKHFLGQGSNAPKSISRGMRKKVKKVAVQKQIIRKRPVIRNGHKKFQSKRKPIRKRVIVNKNKVTTKAMDNNDNVFQRSRFRTFVKRKYRARAKSPYEKPLIRKIKRIKKIPRNGFGEAKQSLRTASEARPSDRYARPAVIQPQIKSRKEVAEGTDENSNKYDRSDFMSLKSGSVKKKIVIRKPRIRPQESIQSSKTTKQILPSLEIRQKVTTARRPHDTISNRQRKERSRDLTSAERHADMFSLSESRHVIERGLSQSMQGHEKNHDFPGLFENNSVPIDNRKRKFDYASTDFPSLYENGNDIQENTQSITQVSNIESTTFNFLEDTYENRISGENQDFSEGDTFNRSTTWKPRPRNAKTKNDENDVLHRQRESGFTRSDRNPHLRSGFWPRVYNSASGHSLGVSLMFIIQTIDYLFNV